jgi:hypothetical protein
MKKQTKIIAATDAAALEALDDFVGYTEEEYAEIQRIQRECHVSLEDAITMFGWWHGKRVP